jgi:hypothetical protein
MTRKRPHLFVSIPRLRRGVTGGQRDFKRISFQHDEQVGGWGCRVEWESSMRRANPGQWYEAGDNGHMDGIEPRYI